MVGREPDESWGYPGIDHFEEGAFSELPIGVVGDMGFGFGALNFSQGSQR